MRPAMPSRSPFRCFKTSSEIIRLSGMRSIRFPLSLRNVEDLLHERVIDICHGTVRFRWHRFGPMFAAGIRRKRVDQMRACQHWRWHPDEVIVKINGEKHYLWRAVDHGGEVLESFVTRTREKNAAKNAALKFLRKTLKRHGDVDKLVTDRLRSYGAALRELGIGNKQQTGRWARKREENAHLPFRRRERAMLRFRRIRTLQKFAAVHASVSNHFNQERSLSSRSNYKTARAAALEEWRGLLAA